VVTEIQGKARRSVRAFFLFAGTTAAFSALFVSWPSAVGAEEATSTAAWEFDGSLADRAGAVEDNLAVKGAPAARFVKGVYGQAVVLGVEPGDADFLVAAPSADTRLGADYSIEAWIFPTQTGGWRRLVLNWGAAPNYAYHFALRDGRVSLYHAQSDGEFAICEGGSVQSRRWQHIAAVASRNAEDPAQSLLGVYLDGKRVAQTAFDGSSRDNGDEPLGIGDVGSASASSGIGYQGYLDSLVIRKYAMSDAEVAAAFAKRPDDLEQRTMAMRVSFWADGGMPDFGEIVFAERNPGRDPSGHYYANFGYACTDENEWLHGADGARLCRLHPKTGKLTVLLDDPQGGIRDPSVSYDASKVLFSYRKGGTHHYNLYEVNVDGTGLKQLTSGDWDDVEPTYLPDGDIVFCSTRCQRYVLCWFAPVATMHRCNADGSDIRRLSSGSVTENTPAILPDGRILYTRWEYVNRDAVSFHHLWAMNPDGSGATIFYGNQQAGGVYIDAQPIPGSSNLVYVDSGYHGQNEHRGVIHLLSVHKGPNDRTQTRAITGNGFRDPYPISDTQFLAAYNNELVYVDDSGKVASLWQSNRMVHEPRLIAPRPREPVIHSRVDLAKATGTLSLTDVYQGRKMAGVARGSIRKLLVMEDLSKPINYHGGGTTPIAHGGKWTLNRILGTVPVESDGSAHFEVPAGRSIYLAALDENDLCVKQMRSFVTVMPGESASCIGCHEQRTRPPHAPRATLASERPPSVIEPIPDVPEVMDFPRDIQPVLDRHCAECHNADRRDGGVVLTGDRGPTYSLAYYNLMLYRQIKDTAGLRWQGEQNVGGRPAGNDAPYENFSFAAPLMKKLDGSHYDARLSDRERTLVRLWLDSATPYAGTYAAYGTGQIGGWWRANQPIREMANDWPSTSPAQDATQRRCADCHQNRMPRFVTDQIDSGDGHGDFEGWMRPVSRFSRHNIFNLTHPDRSLALRVGLAKAAGGDAEGPLSAPKPIPSDLAVTPEPSTHPVIFTDTDDPDYQAILTHLQVAGKRLDEIKRFDMPGFQPRYEYLREMKRYGVLPAEFDLTQPTDVDPYELDRRYWQQFHHRPANSSS